MQQFKTAEEVLAAKHRAYSIINVKDITETDDVYKISGIATTPRTDRVGDIVESAGAEFALPLPFLWQHDSHKPVGTIVDAKASSKSIRFSAEIPKIKEAGALRDRIEEAIQSIRYKLVGAVSIGFRPLKDGFEFMEEGGILFKTWEWLELSLVTIPANPDARITSLKSLDNELRAALGAKATTGVVKFGNPSPGASGNAKQIPTRSKDMRTIKEQLAACEAKRAASAAALAELVQKSGEKGETLNDEESANFDELEIEVNACDAQIKRLKVADKLNSEKAQTVDGNGEASGTRSRVPALSGIRLESRLDPGIRFARMAMAIARAKASNGMGSPESFYRNDPVWMSSAPEVAGVLKAAVNAGDTTTSTWASELAYAQNIAAEFIEFLRPQTILGRVSGWRNVPFNVRVASQTSGSTGYWVGQGKPIPMSKLATSSVSLGIAKLAGVVSIDKELARLSTPSAELLVRNDLAKECQETADLSLIDPNQGGQTNIQPASLTYGVTPVSPSGTAYANFVTDVKSLFTTAIAAQLNIASAVWVISPTTALGLSLMVTSLGNPQFPGLSINGGTLMGLPVVVTTAATIAGSPQYSNIMVLLFPGEVFLADDGAATVEASDQVAIEMLDNPTNQSTATSTATSMVSMWQTESIAVKAVRYINWTKARTSACAFIQAAAYA
jgi:HK97 family phage major capsid protein/HK97 family phage prohead protease